MSNSEDLLEFDDDKPTGNSYLVFDISNLLFRTFFANKNEAEEVGAGMAHHAALTTLNMYFKKFKPSKTIMTFDRPSWRKEYTKSELCLSGRPYKGNRRQKMTPKEAEKFQRFMDHVHHFEEIMRDRTAVCCLAADLCEADDMVAGFVQEYAEDNRITIVSADQDFIQLLYNDNVELIDPASGKSRRQLFADDFDSDVEYFMFQKCLRGDSGDNVMSAFPRVRKTRIMKAYTDPYERANLMHETWSDAEKEYVVKDLFEENQLLMDLRYQPEGVRAIVSDTIKKEMEDPGKYSHFHFLKFLGQYELRKITESIDNFVPMLSR